MSDTINTKPKKLGRGLASLIGMPITLPDSVLRGEAAAVGGEGGSVAAGIPAGDGHDAGGGPSQGENEGKNEGDTGATLGGRRLVFAKVDEVVPSPFQPRRNFDEGSLSALAESIRSAGVMQPVLVRRVGVTYELVAGERRWRAARTAGLFEIPAVVVNITDEEAAQWGIVENVQREDLSVMERAAAYDNLARRFALTHAAVADRVGVDRASVSHFIRLLDLEESIRIALERGELSAGHGKALLTLPPGPGRLTLGRSAAEQGWSVRQLEEAVNLFTARLERAGGAFAHEDRSGQEAMAAGAQEATEGVLAARARALQRAEIEKRLTESLGTKVRVTTDRKGVKGRITIAFYSLDQFEGLMGKMGVGS